MKVLTIINSATIGGVEKTLLSCLRNMKDKDVQMSILCFSKGRILEDEFRSLGVEFLYIKKTGLITFDFIQLFFVLFKHKFDIVHSRFGFTSGGFALASAFLKKKIFVSLHSTKPLTLKSFENRKSLYKLLSLQLKLHKYLTYTFATKIIGHSKANLDNNFPNWKSDTKFELIYNGVDFKELDSNKNVNNKLDQFIKEDDFVILHIGSFREPKNHFFLIDCFYSLKPMQNNLKLILVGSGSLMEKVREKVKQLRISDKVFFAGFDLQTKQYFEKSDLFILPSLNEGLANVLIEAQYKELPICVSDIPSLYESGYKGYHKYYFNPIEKEQAVEQLEEIIKDIKIGNLDKTKEDAKKFVTDNFSIKSMVKNLLKVYSDN